MGFGGVCLWGRGGQAEGCGNWLTSERLKPADRQIDLFIPQQYRGPTLSAIFFATSTRYSNDFVFQRLQAMLTSFNAKTECDTTSGNKLSRRFITALYLLLLCIPLRCCVWVCAGRSASRGSGFFVKQKKVKKWEAYDRFPYTGHTASTYRLDVNSSPGAH